ncbi:MAG: hypothetical protein K0S96_1175 [Geminicoccaceae bacterium]|nr:hypothetical protein [Geminicoccaceae bacterium]
MATAGSQGKATAPPAGRARDRPGASETARARPRNGSSTPRERAWPRHSTGKARPMGKTRTWRHATNLVRQPRSGPPRQPAWNEPRSAECQPYRGRSRRARQRSADALPGRLPLGGGVERRPARRRSVPVTTDALVGAHDTLRRRRPLAACTSATARRRARLHVGWTCLAPVAESRCGCTPGSTMHGMPDPRLRTPALALVDPNRGAEARSAGERRDRVATYSSGSDKARASAHIASWCLRTGMLMKLRASSSSMRCCGVARNAFSLPMPSKK